MAELRKAALLAAHNFQKWPVNPRVYVVFLLELAYVHWMVLAPGDRDHILSGVFNQFLSALTEPVE